MVSSADAEPTASIREEDAEAEAENILRCSDGTDVCKALMDRYSGSSAPQHRHLCASAFAIRSILTEEGLPLSPPAYFAAAITAIRDSDSSDPNATIALSALLSLLLPLIPNGSLAPPKAKDAAAVLASFLRDPAIGTTPTGTVRSMIKSLGFLVLRVDLEDWAAVELPLDTLLVFAVNRRPKVRRCAQVCVEKLFKALRRSIVIKNASKVVLHMYKKYILIAKKLTTIEQSKALSKPEHIETLHVLNVMKFVAPYLSEKVKTKIMFDVYKLLGGCFSWLTRNILTLLESLLECSEPQILVMESEDIISTLISYVSFAEKNPVDTVISASTLLINVLNKLNDAQPRIWIQNLPPIFTSIAGLLSSDCNTSKHAAEVLKKMITIHIDLSSLQNSTIQSYNCHKGSTPETTAIMSICTFTDNMLGACNFPTEYMLAVVSVLFLKLGELSYFHMNNIVYKLSRWIMLADKESPNMKQLEECLGAAVIAMGPERLLSIIPITLHAEKMKCSNTWLIPILKKYVVGASLQYFMEHIVPLAKSLQNACNEVDKTHAHKRLQSYARGLWSLLPAFCRYPTDTSRNFKSFAKLLIIVLREDPSLHETIAIALKELVNNNTSILTEKQDATQCRDSLISTICKECHTDSKSFPFEYSKKTAAKNIKALSSNSTGLFQTLTDVFYDSPTEAHTCLKEAIGCLASILDKSFVINFLVSSQEKFCLVDALAESRKLEGEVCQDKKEEGVKKEMKKDKYKDKRCMLMELASSFIELADADLISIIFHFIKSSLMDTSAILQSEAYYTLSMILKEHSMFCSAQIDELMDILLSVKSSSDNMILKNRLSCLHYLLVHMLKSNEENMNTKAFLILNEIILMLKSKNKSREMAYDILLKVSCSLKNSLSADAESDLLRLFNMVMGYLSSSSTHIMSGAVSALSLLIYNEAQFCLSVPNLITTVLILLQNKDNEVIKATLGFVKVLVSSLSGNDLANILPGIVNGIMPWSSVSKYHFRSKVALIFEMLIRKCGFVSIDMMVPEKYKTFLKKVAEARQSKRNPKDGVGSKTGGPLTDPSRGHKRVLENASAGPVQKQSKTGRFQKENRWKRDEGGASRTAGKSGNIRSSQSNSKTSAQAWARNDSTYKGRKFNEGGIGGNIVKFQRKKDTKGPHSSTALPSKSTAPSRSIKHKKLRT